MATTNLRQRFVLQRQEVPPTSTELRFQLLHLIVSEHSRTLSEKNTKCNSKSYTSYLQRSLCTAYSRNVVCQKRIQVVHLYVQHILEMYIVGKKGYS
uniref:Uncharacterized protein n=1 Tax=Setaria italica TaxID=4555 RepID=K3ZKH9_SETIT